MVFMSLTIFHSSPDFSQKFEKIQLLLRWILQTFATPARFGSGIVSGMLLVPGYL